MTTLFLDMDGVVADWEAGVAEFIGYTLEDPTAHYPASDWQKIRAHVRLFRHLPKMQRADEMVNIARKFRDELGYELIFLTAVPHYNDIHWAFYDKVLWALDNYPDIPVHFGPFAADKQRHCQPGDILVDDRQDNCQHWAAASGIPVNVPREYEPALVELEALFNSKKINP
jgi:hypothetical protein